MRSFISIAFVLAAIGIFYFGIDPAYNNPETGVKALRAEVSDYDKALDNSAKLRKIRGELIGKYNNFDKNSVERLSKLLPDGVDNIRLILDINSIASRYGMNIKGIKINAPGGNSNNSSNNNNSAANPAGGSNIAPPINGSQNPVGSIQLSFSVTTTYENFTQFLLDLERSLRIVDVVGVTFVPDEKTVNANTYNVTIQTYWLK